MRMFNFINRQMRARVMPQPAPAQHAEYSMLFSAEDDTASASPQLIELALEAIHFAKDVSMEPVCARMPMPPYFPNIWPGECYKLLAGLTHALAPKSVVEIGTGAGTSTLTIFKQLASDAKITTFDIMPLSYFDENVLHEEDFKTGRLIQYLENLAEPETFEKHRKLFENADMIYIDAAKDGKLEEILIKKLHTVSFHNEPLIIFDDIRVWNMLKIWREIPFSKLDLTSFGHWTGTGIVAWGKKV